MYVALSRTSHSSREKISRDLINNYIIAQVILAFQLVLAYDILEDRRTIDAIIAIFFPLCFKMAESFENLDNIFQTTNARFKRIRNMIFLKQSQFFATHLNRLR